MSENPVRQKFSRHIDIRRYFIREVVKAEIVKRIPLRTYTKWCLTHSRKVCIHQHLLRIAKLRYTNGGTKGTLGTTASNERKRHFDPN